MTLLSKLSTTAMAGIAALLSSQVQAQSPVCEGAPSETRLIIDIEGMSNSKGQMAASLYPGDKSQFLIKDGALKVWYAPVRMPVTQMCIWLKQPGTYAVAVYHDGNSNHKLDLSLFGYSEKMGFSNNPHLMLAKPGYESVRFQAKTGETTLRIRLVSGKG